jgi:L-alanine-DL-glutamate epimerase-like enolase superfamily enzyme
LERLGVVWLEEPLARYDIQGLSQLASEVDIPIAGGELNKGLHEFKWLLDHGCYDIIQPNCTFSEGMFQIRKLAALAETCYKKCIPHAWTSGPGFVANLQVAASIPGCVESLQGTLQEPLKIDKEGYVHLPQRPGIGVELNREAIAKFRVF